MKKFRLFGWKLCLVRTLLYAVLFCSCGALLSLLLLLLNNPLPLVLPCSLALLFVIAFAFGYTCSREENVWLSLLAPICLCALWLSAGFILSDRGGSPLSLLYAVLFLGVFLLGRVLPHPKRRHRRFE